MIHAIESPHTHKRPAMNTHLKLFITKYLTIVFATLMSVSFFAFLAIPYGLGGHPGDERAAQGTTMVTVAEPQV